MGYVNIKSRFHQSSAPPANMLAAYQTAKYKYKDTGELTRGYTAAELERGFVAKGLWAYSRHPNFFAEQTIWFVLYSWSCFAANTPYSWAGTGAVLLVLLFQGSTYLTEKITKGKYPEYESYQKQVGMFIPKRLAPYWTPTSRVLRSSDLAKRAEQKLAEKQVEKQRTKDKKKQG